MKNTFSIPFVAIVLLTLLVFGIIHWTNLPFSFIDWVIGVTLFWWLLLITTVPWNLHFKAKEVLLDGKDSKHAKLEVDEKDMAYARKISKTYLVVAILLHLFSFAGFYYLAASGISVVGYYGAGAALLLTALRPSIRLYEYLNYRLNQVKERIKYPRQDILEVRGQVADLQGQTEAIQYLLDQSNTDSWASQLEKQNEDQNKEIHSIRDRYTQLITDLQVQQKQIVNNTEQKIAQISEDAVFLNQVRQLLRFIKEA